MPDKIDEAISSLDKSAVPLQMVKVEGKLPTGKPYSIVVTADFDAIDALCLHSQVNALYDQIEAHRQRNALALPNRQLVLPT